MKILLIALLLASCTVTNAHADENFEFKKDIAYAATLSDIEKFAFLHGEIVGAIKIIAEQKNTIDELIDNLNKNTETLNKSFDNYDKKFVVMAKKIAELQLKIVELEGKTGAQTRW